MTRSVPNLLLLLVLTTASTLAAMPVQAQIEVTKSNGTITIDGTNLDDVVTVSIPNANVVRVEANGQITDFPCQTNGGSAPMIMFFGLGGADEFVNQTPLTAAAYGGSGPDRLIATTGPAMFYGEGGEDFLIGSSQADTLDGGVGNDEIFGFEGSDDIFGGGGADYAVGGVGNDTISGGLGADELFGQEGEDVIRGDAGEDYISGGLGADFIDGGSQDDQLLGADGNDNIIGGPGNDLMLGGLGSDSLCGGLGDDELRGGDGNDSLFGEEGVDVLLGGAGIDNLDQDTPGPCDLNGFAWPTAFEITHVPLYTIDGDSAGDNFGYSVSGAGDVNGDGRADFIVGAIRDNNNGTDSGSARVFSGLDGSILYTFDGDAGDRFGRSVSSAGDVNGDGRADIIVGTSRDDNNGTDSGSARVFSGLDGSILYTFDGDSAYDRFGESVSSAGDVDGDGRADLIVGASGDDNNGASSGSARVFSGLDGSILYTFYGDDQGDALGRSVSSAGDVNGDGRADLIVGASFDDNNGAGSGSARVFSGLDGSILYTFEGDVEGDVFGYSVSSAGDVNGDGRADLIVGAWNVNSGRRIGSARVLSGLDGSILYNFQGRGAGDHFGWSVSSAGDVNGDGRADMIVGALGASGRSGSARVLSGLDGSVLYDFEGDELGGDFGFSVSDLGDINGDRLSDFIVGSTRGGANDGGYARVFVSQGLPEFLLGDVNRDDVVNFLDIAPFITLLSSNTFQVEADINGDQDVNFLDIAPFITMLSSF